MKVKTYSLDAGITCFLTKDMEQRVRLDGLEFSSPPEMINNMEVNKHVDDYCRVTFVAMEVMTKNNN